MKLKLFLFILLSMLSFANSVKVAVAANVSYAIEDLIKDFKKMHPDANIEYTIGSSGKLTAQILHGAPYSLFLSADMKYPQALFDKHIALDAPKIYVQGLLAIFTTKDDINISEGLSVLKSDKIKKIAVANPLTAPYGVAAKEALQNAKIYALVKPKFIYGESIGQALTYTITAADIGLVAKSTLFSKKLSRFKEGKNWIDVDKTLYKPTKQGIVLLKNAKNSAIAKEFYNYLLSKRAKEIFKKFGYDTEYGK